MHIQIAHTNCTYKLHIQTHMDGKWDIHGLQKYNIVTTRFLHNNWFILFFIFPLTGKAVLNVAYMVWGIVDYKGFLNIGFKTWERVCVNFIEDSVSGWEQCLDQSVTNAFIGKFFVCTQWSRIIFPSCVVVVDVSTRLQWKRLEVFRQKAIRVFVVERQNI